jgi:tetratricopeptide (TPR) repeat protein
MKQLLFTLLLIVLTIGVRGQKFNFKTSPAGIDSVIEVDGMNFHKYLGMNLTYPIDAQKNQVVGIYIGRIRLDSKGNLIEVSTVNPVSKSINEGFVKLINKTWKSHKVSARNIPDTTDFIISVKYMFSSGYLQPPLEYFVNYDQKPKFVSDEISVVCFNSNGTASQVDDMTLLNKANDLYHAEKYKRSIDYLDQLINRNPYSEDLLYMRANAYKNLNDTTNACRDYQYLKYFLKSTKLKGLTQCE